MSEEEVINNLINEACQTAKDHGFWEKIPIDNELGLPTRLALIHSEVSEALDAYRDDDMIILTEEMADIVIRVFDVCGAYNLPFYNMLKAKMERNRIRPILHGRKRF